MRKNRRNGSNKLSKFLPTIKIVAAVAIVLFILISFLKIVVPIFLIDDADKDKVELIRPVGTTSTINDIKRELNKKNIIFDTIKESSSSSIVIVSLREGPTVYFSKTEDALWQVNSLELIVHRLSLEDKKPKSIDFRSVRPIVKF